MNQIQELARKYQDTVVALRREFHRHPELSYEEVETTKRLRDDLAAAGIEVLDLPLKTGLVAKVGTGEAPFIALRCDIDADPGGVGPRLRLGARGSHARLRP